MEMIQKDQQPHFSTPNNALNAGAVEVESKRAVAEALAQVRLAQIVGRDLNAIYAEVMEACSVPAMAEVAFYELPQGGQKVSGPSIKLIEQIASAMGHFEWGHRELSRTETTPEGFGRSEIEVFVWDKLKNNRSIRQITIIHARDSSKGAQPLRYQRDIDNHIANIAAKQMRGRLQALLPKWLVEAAIQRCRDTLAGTSPTTISERVRKMITTFGNYGVKPEMLAAYLEVKSLENVTIDQLTSLHGVYQAIKEGARVSDYFKEAAEETSNSVTEMLNALPESVPEPIPAPIPAPKPVVAEKQVAEAAAPAASQPEPHPQPQAEQPMAPQGEPEKGILF